MPMARSPERLDIQLRRAWFRRSAVLSAWTVGILSALGLAFMRWTGFGWRWSYLLIVPLAVVFALWIGWLTGDSDEEVTRWFWRPPR
jgi:hypothetical protein